jgi:glucokinase
VSVGTGISYALVLNGVVYRGARGAAIQLGNSVAAEWETDGVRHTWVLEEIASGPAMLTRYLKLGGIGATTEAVLAAYGEEEAATRAVRETARAFGIGLGLLVNLLDPDVVVVGGGLGSAPGPFWDLGVAAARDHVWCDAARSLPILQAELGPRSAAVGAAIVGFEASRPVLT